MELLLLFIAIVMFMPGLRIRLIPKALADKLILKCNQTISFCKAVEYAREKHNET